MTVDSSLFQMMYTISASLLYPVIILLLLSVITSLAAMGEFVSEYSRRKRDTRKLEQSGKQVKEKLGRGDLAGAEKLLSDIGQNDLVNSFAAQAARYLGAEGRQSMEWLAEEYEVRMTKKLEVTKILSTVSPMLGLMGTLIPLGPALIGLAEGDILQLTHNLTIAFATTVLGLFAGVAGYVLTLVRKRWYWQDMTDIDYITDIIEGER